MDLTSISALATGTLSDFGDEVLVVLTAVIGIAIAYFLFKFAWRKIKGSVSDGGSAMRHAVRMNRVATHNFRSRLNHFGE